MPSREGRGERGRGDHIRTEKRRGWGRIEDMRKEENRLDAIRGVGALGGERHAVQYLTL